MKSFTLFPFGLAVVLTASGCNVATASGNEATAAPKSVPPRADAGPAPGAGVAAAGLREAATGIRFVVDRSDRALYVQRGDEVIRRHPVAIGKPGNETPTGTWSIGKVDLNPEWIPPDSDWSKDRTRKAPGDPNNPMGRARLIFDSPYSIHGTDDLESLGGAESHGSIRVANADVVDLARLVVRAGGKWQGDAWFDERLGNRTQMTEIDLDDPVPIEVRN